jgi:hypothetical protein
LAPLFGGAFYLLKHLRKVKKVVISVYLGDESVKLPQQMRTQLAGGTLYEGQFIWHLQLLRAYGAQQVATKPVPQPLVRWLWQHNSLFLTAQLLQT